MKKEIEKLKGYYISEEGNVYDSKGIKLKKYINPCGYYYVIIEERYYSICYLVANAFIPTEKGICIRHIDGNKLNDNKDNLEWYYEGEVEIKSGVKINKEVVEYDFDGNIINKWNNIKECSENTNFSISHLRNICNGTKSMTKDNRIFRYIDDKFVRPEIKIKKEKIKEPKVKRYKRIFLINPDGLINSEFKDINDCSNKLNLSKGNIYNCLLQRSSYKKGQLFFVYEDKYEENKDRLLEFIEEYKSKIKEYNKSRTIRNRKKRLLKNNITEEPKEIILEQIEQKEIKEETKQIEKPIIKTIEEIKPIEIIETNEINNKPNKLNMMGKLKGFIKGLFK